MARPMIMPCLPEQAPPSPSTDENEEEQREDKDDLEAEDTSSLTPDSNPSISVTDSRAAPARTIASTKSKSNSFRVMVELGLEEDDEEGEPINGLDLAATAVSARTRDKLS